ncbi:histidine kinase [Kytococcus sedentarius]|uniref:histidine kinase n=1 Tax=Kytococcus sedentarius TaxID=1276 RepID=UPI00384D0152
MGCTLALTVLGSPLLLAASAQDMAFQARLGWGLLGLVLLGLGTPLVALAASRLEWSSITDWLDLRGVPAAHPHNAGTRGLARPLAWIVLTSTLGGAAVLSAFLVAIAAVVGLVSPFLVAAGDQVVIGPVTVRSLPAALLAMLLGATALYALGSASPIIARTHARRTLQVLTPPEERLQRELMAAASSRLRLLQGFDVERRRIERDLHDGIQPQLLSAGMTLGLALSTMPRDTPGRPEVEQAITRCGEPSRTSGVSCATSTPAS